MDELKQLFPSETKVKLGDKEVVVKTFKVKDISMVADFFERIVEKRKDFEKMSDKEKKTALMPMIIDAIKTDTESVIGLISKSTDIKEEEIGEFGAQALIFLIKHVVKENLEFFQEQMLPEITNLFESLQGAGDKMTTQQAAGAK